MSSPIEVRGDNHSRLDHSRRRRWPTEPTTQVNNTNRVAGSRVSVLEAQVLLVGKQSENVAGGWWLTAPSRVRSAAKK